MQAAVDKMIEELEARRLALQDELAHLSASASAANVRSAQAKQVLRGGWRVSFRVRLCACMRACVCGVCVACVWRVRGLCVYMRVCVVRCVCAVCALVARVHRGTVLVVRARVAYVHLRDQRSLLLQAVSLSAFRPRRDTRYWRIARRLTSFDGAPRRASG